MWICLNNAYFSIVADRNDSKKLLVRARRSGDIEKVFNVQETVDPRADYRFRAHIDRPLVNQVMIKQVDLINYDNFKNSVENQELHDAYMRIWSIMNKVQLREVFGPGAIDDEIYPDGYKS